MDEMVVETGRRVLATLPVGTPLIAAVDAICSRHEITQGEVRLRGALRDVVLALGDETEPHTLTGTVQVISAEGELAPDLGVTGFFAVVAWSDRGLPRVAAGFIEQAESAGVRVSIEVWDEVARESAPRPRATPAPRGHEPRPEPPPVLERPATPRRDVPAGPAPTVRGPSEAARPSPAAGKPAGPTPASRPGTSPAAAPPEPAPPAAGGGWAAAVAASKAPPTGGGRPGVPGITSNGAGPLDEDPEAKAGDILVHPQFGRCKVVGSTEGERVKIRMATGRFVDLHLGYVKLQRQADEDGVRVFRVHPTKR